MNVGELFLNLGIKGTDKTLGALSGVKKGLGETAHMSLEAKAGILAALYALERLFAASGAAGTGLTNFNALTGLSTKQLQQWQYAARQAGVSNEEFTGSLKAVQTGMTNMLLGKGAPEGMAMLANKVGFDPKRARDTFYVMEQLQKFAKTVPPDIGNAVMKSFGVGEGVIAGMRRNMFTPQLMAKAPSYGTQEIASLDRANIAWSNLGNKIEMAIGHFNAKHGMQLVGDISHITDQVVRLAEAFVTLGEKLKIFQVIGKVFEGWTTIFSGLTKGVESVQDPKKRKELGNDTASFFKDMPAVFKAMAEDLFHVTPAAPGAPGLPGKPGSSGLPGKPGSAGLNIPKTSVIGIPSVSKSITPVTAHKPGPATGSTQHINVNQNLHFQHDGKDHKKTSDSVKKANQDAFRQFPQGQVS